MIIAIAVAKFIIIIRIIPQVIVITLYIFINIHQYLLFKYNYYIKCYYYYLSLIIIIINNYFANLNYYVYDMNELFFYDANVNFTVTTIIKPIIIIDQFNHKMAIKLLLY